MEWTSGIGITLSQPLNKLLDRVSEKFIEDIRGVPLLQIGHKCVVVVREALPFDSQ